MCSHVGLGRRYQANSGSSVSLLHLHSTFELNFDFSHSSRPPVHSRASSSCLGTRPRGRHSSWGCCLTARWTCPPWRSPSRPCVRTGPSAGPGGPRVSRYSHQITFLLEVWMRFRLSDSAATEKLTDVSHMFLH